MVEEAESCYLIIEILRPKFSLFKGKEAGSRAKKGAFSLSLLSAHGFILALLPALTQRPDETRARKRCKHGEKSNSSRNVCHCSPSLSWRLSKAVKILRPLMAIWKQEVDHVDFSVPYNFCELNKTAFISAPMIQGSVEKYNMFPSFVLLKKFWNPDIRLAFRKLGLNFYIFGAWLLVCSHRTWLR